MSGSVISPLGPSRPTNTHVLIYAGDLRGKYQSSVENPDDFSPGNGHWGGWGLPIDGGQGCVLIVFQEALGTVREILASVCVFGRSYSKFSLFVDQP